MVYVGLQSQRGFGVDEYRFLWHDAMLKCLPGVLSESWLPVFDCGRSGTARVSVRCILGGPIPN